MDSREKWATEISRSVQSIHDSQFVTEKGLITEKALEIFHIPRSVQDIDVITLADEYNCALEATVALFLMATRDGEPRTGANLYSPGIGLLSWDINWTALTKAKIWRLHQALRVGCKDDLDFVIKLAYCFLRAEKNNVAEWWAKYFQINYQIMQDALNGARDILASHYRMNALEEERAIDINIVVRMRQVFILTWQNKIAEITDDKPVSCLEVEKERIAAISSHCICSRPKGEKVILAAAIDGTAIVGDYPRQMPVASFIVCLIEESKKEKVSNIFIDQFLPIGSLVNVTERGKETLVGEAAELPPAITFYYKQTLNGEGSSKKERLSPVEFAEKFLCSEFKENDFEIEGDWVSNDMAKKAIIIGWAEKAGRPVAILAPNKNSDDKSNFEVGTWLETTIRKVVRDPSGKGGLVLIGLNHGLDIPTETIAISLSPVGYGLEEIEGQTIDLRIEGFDEDGNLLLTNISQITKDIKTLRDEILKSEKATKTSERSYIDLSAFATEINEDEEKAVVSIVRKEGIIHSFEVNQTYVPGEDLRSLRINEEIVVRLFSRTDNDEISVEYFTEKEINSMPRGWGANKARDKIVLPLCLEDKDLKGWNVRPELIDFVKRHSWQYCIGARVVFLKERISKLKKGSVVIATVKKIDYNKEGKIQKMYVIFGDSIPESIPGRLLSSTEISEGDEISLCISSVDPETGKIQLVDVQYLKDKIEGLENNILKAQEIIESNREQIRKIEANISKNERLRYKATSIERESMYDQWIAEGRIQIVVKKAKIHDIQCSINKWKEKISSIQRELEELQQE